VDALGSAEPIVPSDADELVASLAAEAEIDLPEATVSIAAMPVAGDGLAVSGGDRLVKSASTAKVWFAAAALAVNPIEAVEPWAHDTFAQSSDFAAGHLVELAGGPDAVNRFTRDRVGMADTGLVRWVGERTVRATDVDQRLGSSNYTTVPDMALFLRRLARGELLDQPRTDALLSWMRLSPRNQGVDEYGGRLPDQLPPAVQADAAHKAGWLFPEDGEDFWLLDFGIVQPPAGDAYVFVLAGNTDSDYSQLKEFVGRASCLTYRTLGHDAAWPCPSAA
jgi:beta-lactamase class A